MKKQLQFIILICSAIILFSAKSKEVQEPPFEIAINTLDSSLQVNGTYLQSYKIADLENIIGKPDRVKTHVFKSYYEEFGAEKMARTVIPITVTDYYYIYDKLGIMFYTHNGMSVSKNPDKFSIHFKNKRTFTNIAALPYLPATAFKGILKINADTVSAMKKLIPGGVNYQTETIDLFHTTFGATSIATVIDGLYSKSTQPSVLLYLDSEKEQRISYIVIQ